MTDDANREFLFTYRFGGVEWGASVHAANPAEAKEKIKAMSLARYDGETVARIYVPTWFGRLFSHLAKDQE